MLQQRDGRQLMEIGVCGLMVTARAETGKLANGSRISAIVRDSIGVSISACHADDPGSIPGLGGGQQSSVMTIFYTC